MLEKFLMNTSVPQMKEGDDVKIKFKKKTTLFYYTEQDYLNTVTHLQGKKVQNMKWLHNSLHHKLRMII